jgi:L-amino acid N-acyltransferase YncA
MLFNELVEFYLLKCFDERYEVSSYGVWISDKFSGQGLSKLTLQHAITFCKVNSFKYFTSKVHPDNVVTISLYESLVFIKFGFDDEISSYIYHKSFSN